MTEEEKKIKRREERIKEMKDRSGRRKYATRSTNPFGGNAFGAMNNGFQFNDGGAQSD